MLCYTKGSDDRHRNELEEEEQETLQYSQVHHSGANGEDDYTDDGEFSSVEEDGDEDSRHMNDQAKAFSSEAEPAIY